MKKEMKLAVIISGTGRTLYNLISHRYELEPARIGLVISTKRNAPGLQYAIMDKIPCLELPREDYVTDYDWSKEVCKALESHKINAVALAGCIHRFIIPDWLENKVLNIHPSLLPAFGGRGYYGKAVHQAVYDSGVKITGCTVHFATNQYDVGPIIIQKHVQIKENTCVDTIADEVFRVECEVYPKAIRLFARDKLRIDGQRVIKKGRKIKL